MHGGVVTCNGREETMERRGARIWDWSSGGVQGVKRGEEEKRSVRKFSSCFLNGIEESGSEKVKVAKERGPF